MLSSHDIENEGFKPLRKTVTFEETEPTSLASKPEMTRSQSFNARTGKPENVQDLWEDSNHERFQRARGRSMDRANSFIRIGAELDSSLAEFSDAIVCIVDPFSTGAHLAALASSKGLRVVRILSAWDSPIAALVQEGVVNDFYATIQHDDRLPLDEAIKSTVNAIKELPYRVAAVLPGAETGVELTDQLAEAFGMPTNSTKTSAARRNKYTMGEAVRSAGVRAVRQETCKTEEQLLQFLRELRKEGSGGCDPTLTSLDAPLRCVVKPAESAGTDDVFLCNTARDAVVAFHRILGKVNGLGKVNDSVLAQEFLVGSEYVVDMVSKGGRHKICAIWRYDKRPVNDAPFVYFGMALQRPAALPFFESLLAYAASVLDAVGIVEGPSHMEVMVREIPLEDVPGPAGELQRKNGYVTLNLGPVTVDENLLGLRSPNGEGYAIGEGPFPVKCTDGRFTTPTHRYEMCLVEVGARCHGGEGTWLPATMECIGETQVTLALDVALTGESWKKWNGRYYDVKGAAREVDIVARQSGVLRAIIGEHLLRELPSFRSISWEIHPGDFVHRTIDCFTRPGCVQLVAKTEEEAQADLDSVHEIEERRLFDFAVVCPHPPVVATVVVVDPFENGVHLAARVLRCGWKLAVVVTGGDAAKALISDKGTSGNSLQPSVIVQHYSSSRDPQASLASTLQELVSACGDSPILAFFAGSETGIFVAESLGAMHGVRANPVSSLGRRTHRGKQFAALSAAGLSVPKWKDVTSESEILSFFSSVPGNGGIRVGSPHIGQINSERVCHTPQEAIDAFHTVYRQINAVGEIDNSVLAVALSSEISTTKSLLVDGVSRDGNFKAIAVWEIQSVGGVEITRSLANTSNSSVFEEVFCSVSCALEAIELFDGPSQTQIHLKTSSGNIEIDAIIPCVGGTDGIWTPLGDRCLGYGQHQATLDCFLRPDRFEILPTSPTYLHMHGTVASVTMPKTGRLVDLPGTSALTRLASFQRMEFYVQPGTDVTKTVDNTSRVGIVLLAHTDRDIVRHDLQMVHDIAADSLFSVKESV